MVNIVFLDEYALGGIDLSSLHSLGNYTGYNTTSYEQIVERCTQAQIIITNKVPFTRSTMEALPKLKLICVAATGINLIDVEAAQELGIAVKSAMGYSTHSVCETTIGAAIGLLRQIIYYDRYTKTDYSTSPRQYHYRRTTHQLHGSNWAILGLGNIGHDVAKIATALGCEVRYSSLSGSLRKEPYACMPLDELLTWADVVSIHCPLTDRTRGLIGARELSLMKPSSLLINVARGGMVDEAALAWALNNNIIAGAALDVFTHEPIDPGNPLLKIEDPYKLLLSPHNAWSSVESLRNLVECIEHNIKEFLR